MIKRFPLLGKISSILVGIVFTVSGILKIIDPVGTGLIFEEYFKFFNIGVLIPISRIAGILLSYIEVSTGLAMLCGVFKRFFIWFAFVLLSFFIIITIILIVYNPVFDCGCFGEALHLSHFQSFIKNIVLMFLIISYLYFGDFEGKGSIYIYGMSLIFVILFSIYSFICGPVIEFTDFAKGKSIKIGNDYSARFIYEKAGKETAFDLQNLPDSTWHYVRTELTTKNSNRNVSVLSFKDSLGIYKDDVLEQGKYRIISVYDLKYVNKIFWQNVISQILTSDNILVLVAVEYYDFLSFIEKFDFSEEEIMRLLDNTYYSDYKTLITLNRSNGGLTILEDGVIISKYNKTGR